MQFEFSTFNNKALALLLFFKLQPPKEAPLTIKQNNCFFYFSHYFIQRNCNRNTFTQQ